MEEFKTDEVTFQSSPSAHRRWDRGSARRARGENLQAKNILSFSTSLSLCATSLIWLTPHPVMLRGTAMEEFKTDEVTFQSSPSAHRRWDRGSARRARGLNLQSNDSSLSLTELIGMRLSTRISLLKFNPLPTDFLPNRCLAREEYKKGAALHAAPFLWLKVVSVKIRLLFYFRSDKYRPVIL